MQMVDELNQWTVHRQDVDNAYKSLSYLSLDECESFSLVSFAISSIDWISHEHAIEKCPFNLHILLNFKNFPFAQWKISKDQRANKRAITNNVA